MSIQQKNKNEWEKKFNLETADFKWENNCEFILPLYFYTDGNYDWMYPIFITPYLLLEQSKHRSLYHAIVGKIL